MITESLQKLGLPNDPVAIVVFGASGDLARKKTYPALFGLYRMNYLPDDCKIIGYARSAMSQQDFRSKMAELLRPFERQRPNKEKSMDAFLDRCCYVSGQYDSEKDYLRMKDMMQEHAVHIFYFAVPPSVFLTIAKHLSNLFKHSNHVRLVVEKPFGKDAQSSAQLQTKLRQLYAESQIFRIDHYLGKEMVKNLLVFRFANLVSTAFWNCQYISNIQITFKEDFGAEGRGGYFDEYGIIRDVMQNHLMQILALVAMDQPSSLNIEGIRDEKTRILNCVEPAKLENVVIGQYVASEDGQHPGYTADPTVDPHSLTSTFASVVLYIRHPRWEGVPFIVKCGKALDTLKTEIRLQFKDSPNNLFPNPLARNELVIRVSPSEAVYLKMMNKQPGIAFETAVSELDLTYKERYANLVIPGAYESLLLDVLRNDQGNFVRNDELEAAWNIFTPLLHRIDREKLVPEKYSYGSRGPLSADALALKHGFVLSPIEYDWEKSRSKKTEQ